MTLNLIKALVKEPNKPCKVVMIDDSLKSYQKQVGGLIEFVVIQDLHDKGIVCYCNEEGKILELKPNFALSWNGKVYDIVVGSVVFVRDDEDGGSTSLTDDDIKLIKTHLRKTSKVVEPLHILHKIVGGT